MTNRPAQYLCVHSHFARPPRGNPLTGDIGIEPDAAPYANWNERATVHSYRPNAQIGNFDAISFDIGEPLMFWLRDNAPETYQRIVQADRAHLERFKVGNAMGSPFYDVILPLRKRRDKHTLLYWGRAAFAYHYGHLPQGLWLPECAIDPETLHIAESMGYRYTIIAQGQAASFIEGGGPFRVDLGNGREFFVFVRNDDLSNDLSFNIGAVGGAGHWARNKLAGRRGHRGMFTLLATDGETFGTHYLGEEQFLHWLLIHEAQAVGFRIATLGVVLRESNAQPPIEIKPYSSWSCFHGVSRWSTGCPCTPGYSGWKSMLLRAFDNLSDNLDELYIDAVRSVGVDPWGLRDDYIRVWLGEVSGPAFLAEFAPGLSSGAERRTLAMLQVQMVAMRSYLANTFMHADLDAPEPRYAIANMAYALHLLEETYGREISDPLVAQFKNDLFLASSGITEIKGSQIYDQLYEELFVPKPPPEEVEAPSEEESVTAGEDTRTAE